MPDLFSVLTPMSLQRIESGEPLFEAFVSHLAAAGLPTEDLLLEPARYYALSPHGEVSSAFGGLLLLQEEALLRSVIVPGAGRHHGCGSKIVGELAALAEEEGATRLWLLTTSVGPFFSRLGWREARRQDAPASIASTRQFSSLCPASAMLMCRKLV